jgi:hypothetical protein
MSLFGLLKRSVFSAAGVEMGSALDIGHLHFGFWISECGIKIQSTKSMNADNYRTKFDYRSKDTNLVELQPRRARRV